MPPARPAPTPAQLEEDARDAAAFARCLDYVRTHARGEVEGVFGPDSVHWAIAREPGSLFGTGAAVLLHLAHPAVAAGVASHSNWERDFVGRAQRTFTSLYQFMFGALDDATQAAHRLHQVHRRVRGVVEEPGSGWTGRPYRANDQALLRWVGLSVAVGMRRSFELFVRPFTDAERAADERERPLSSALSGILPDPAFATAAAVDRYYEAMLTSEELVVGPLARRIAAALFNSPYTRGPVDEILCAGMLPERFRDAYGLAWGRRERAAFESMRRLSRGGHRVLPGPMHGVVAWHQARLRVARAQRLPEPTWARAINALDRRMNLPTSLRPVAPLGSGRGAPAHAARGHAAAAHAAPAPDA